MNAYTALLATEHIEYLRAEAAQRRQVQSDQPSLLDRIASAASTVRQVLALPLDNRGTILPRLEDYPYRS
jgi:hypothetical protein